MTTLKGNYYEDALLCLRARKMGIALAETNLPLLHLGQRTAKTEARAHDGAEHNRLIFERAAMNYIREKLGDMPYLRYPIAITADDFIRANDQSGAEE